MGSGSYANPFDPNFNNFYLNDQPQAGWWNYIMGRGWGGLDNQSRYAQQAFGRYNNIYAQQAGQHPTEGFYDWLRRTNPDVGGEYWNQSQTQRGDATAGFYTPRARWVMGA